MSADSSSDINGSSPPQEAASSPPSSLPAAYSPKMADEPVADAHLEAEEDKARSRNLTIENRRKTAALRRRKKKAVTKAEREKKAEELDELLKQSAAFAGILTNKTQVLGRVGTGLDGKVLGEHDLEMAEQPNCLSGGTMRDYQLEGVTWMIEVCAQGMSGILADEMGLGKTIQTIGFIGHLREKENYLGPHLIVAPLSTLSNWIAEFQNWAPSIPVLMYHGTPEQRKTLRETEIMRHLTKGKPTRKFPVVCTSYEMVIRDSAHLSQVNWDCIIIDEGHRMKNSDARLFQEVCKFTSASRFLITGTPLQNNLKELWSLLHFLMPNVFRDWEAFEFWFDFSELDDEEGTQQFIEDKSKQDLVKKIHTVLQPLLLRRVKADVAHYLPPKREYVLYAKMTKEQTDLYNVICSPRDTRSYLEDKIVERLTGTTNTPAGSRKATPYSSRSASVGVKAEKDVDDDSPTKSGDTANKAFALMMGQPRKRGRPVKNTVTQNGKANKRKGAPTPEAPTPKTVKMVKTSRDSTPSTSTRGRSRRTRQSYKMDESDDDKLSDEEFEDKIAAEYAGDESTKEPSTPASAEEYERASTLELAKKQIGRKKFGNQVMQLRLACNSPHNFYDPFADGVDESVVSSSGKMLLLERLLPVLFERGHKVLIFSQFKTQLDILWDYCSELRNWKVCRIDGSVAQAGRQAQIHQFNTNPDYKIFLLSTRAGGQGINLASADTVILFDSDWNPQQDLQAQDRAHRIGQTRPVIIYRLATKDTVEDMLLLGADAKRRLEKLVIKKGGFRTLGQKKDLNDDDLDKETLRSLLLRDGEVYRCSDHQEILGDKDLDVLLDRSDAAYARAAKGAGNADGYRVVETGAHGLTTTSKSG